MKKAEKAEPCYRCTAENLKDAGCTNEVIRQFLELQDRGEQEEQLRLLSCQRKRLLDRVHREEKKITCLDYLVYQIQHNL